MRPATLPDFDDYNADIRHVPCGWFIVMPLAPPGTPGRLWKCHGCSTVYIEYHLSTMDTQGTLGKNFVLYTEEEAEQLLTGKSPEWRSGATLWEIDDGARRCTVLIPEGAAIPVGVKARRVKDLTLP
jgi:hypothetical protein